MDDDAFRLTLDARDVARAVERYPGEREAAIGRLLARVPGYLHDALRRAYDDERSRAAGTP